MKKTKTGLAFLNKACDKFEPYACRSLGRLMKKSGESALSYMYSKRACHYGLTKSCTNLKKPKSTYSIAGLTLIKKVKADCADTTSPACQMHLSIVGACEKPLTMEDCLLLPGDLAIFFRAKLMQAEAKVSLMKVRSSQNLLKKFTYKLSEVLKDHKPHDDYQYVFGFMKACRKKYGKKKWMTNSLEMYPESYKKLSSRVKANIVAFFGNGKQRDCTDPKVGYEAFAVTNLDPLNPKVLDIWKTDQDGKLVHLKDGLL